MNNIFMTLDNNFIIFDNNIINVIIDTNDKIWFTAKEVATSIGYIDVKDAIKVHVDKKDKI